MEDYWVGKARDRRPARPKHTEYDGAYVTCELELQRVAGKDMMMYYNDPRVNHT